MTKIHPHLWIISIQITKIHPHWGIIFITIRKRHPQLGVQTSCKEPKYKKMAKKGKTKWTKCRKTGRLKNNTKDFPNRMRNYLKNRKCKVVVKFRWTTERSDDTRGPKWQTLLTAHLRTYGCRGRNRIPEVIDLQRVTKEQGQTQNESDTVRDSSSKLSMTKPPKITWPLITMGTRKQNESKETHVTEK